jgi:hypothetical protein
MSEEQFTLAENGPAARRLKISLSVFKTRPLFNVRYYFENKSGEMQPTNKGIALNRNNYFALHNIITKQHDEISHFLNGENKISSIQSFFEKKNIALNSTSAVENVELAVDKIPGRELSDVQYNGSNAEVLLNSKHKYIAKNQTDTGMTRALGDVAVALDLALKSTGEDESSEVIHALERLRAEFSRQLQNLTN